MRGAAERGSAVVLAVAVSAVLLMVSGTLLMLGAALTAGNQARAAADLAALSGAGRLLRGSPSDQACAAAESIAARNGARLLECDVEHAATGPPRLTVVVGVTVPSLGDAEARARARAGGVPQDR